WKLTPTAIYNPNNELVVVQSEQELFRLIDEPYIPPWDRTEQGPQLNRRNNEFQFVAGEYKEKPRAHRVRNYKGRRPSYHELLKQREASAPQTNKDFDFRLTHFENGFDRQELQQRLHNDDDPQ
ncbi:putative DNA polymerase beta-like, partial [Diplonema papillatum]